MYLISLYFDSDTNKKIDTYIGQIARKTGNTYMLDGKVPPHITVSAFETNREETVMIMKELAKELSEGEIQWASVGMFLPYVIYIAPVLNEYLHTLSEKVYEKLKRVPEMNISKYYRPFQWIPHTTIGKKLERDEMTTAFAVMQNQFGTFSGKVTHIGLAKTNPYKDVIVVKLT